MGFRTVSFTIILPALAVLIFTYTDFLNPKSTTYDNLGSGVFAQKQEIAPKKKFPPLDKEAYDKKLEIIANNPVPVAATEVAMAVAESEQAATMKVAEEPQPVPPPNLWPTPTVYPLDGAILPFKRIVAYYGNLFSTKMGALGEWPEEEMLERLKVEVKKWNDADPSTPVLPALHYIVVTAQLDPGKDGKHRLRMPFTEVDKILKMAEKIDAIVFLDVQVGFSTVEVEIPLLEKYLKMPNVHLGIDPEFSMKGDKRPGKVVGTFDATDINFVINYLAGLVKEYELPPKVLVIHRYTEKMVTNYQNIKPVPEVQVVMHMDGWGPKAKKISTYKQFIYKQPVQFTGFKLFYKNDTWDPTSTIFEPEELLNLRPIPLYIQYQ